MSRILLLIVGLLAAAWVPDAKAQDGSVSVRLSGMRTALGIVNADLFPIGTLLVRKRGASTMVQLDTLDLPAEALQRPQSAGLISLAVSSGVSVGVSLNFWTSASAASIASEAKRQMRFYVKDVTTERMKSPLAVLNHPSLAPQRAFYASFYGGDYVYELVYDVKRVNEGGIGFGRPYKVEGRLGFPQSMRMQGLQLAVNYDSSSALEFGGNQAPMFYRTQTFKLVKVAEDFRFVPD